MVDRMLIHISSDISHNDNDMKREQKLDRRIDYDKISKHVGERCA